MVPELQKTTIQDIVKEHLCTFCNKGVSVSVKHYEMVINTGNAPPVSVKKLHYGLFETLIMQKTIDMLLSYNFIVQDYSSPYNSNIVLAPKPHQEDIKNIDDYIWRFCISYIALNLITRVINYPIPRCNNTFMYDFGTACFFILLDTYSGYHQIPLKHITLLWKQLLVALTARNIDGWWYLLD